MTETTQPKPSRLRGFFKYLGLSVLFCAILLGIFWVAGRVLVPKDNTEQAGMVEARAYGFLAEPDNTLDAVFLGDSLASTSFLPMRMWEDAGITSYVCSVNGEQISYALTMLGDFLSHQSPKVVFLETQMLYNPFDIGKAAKQLLKDAFPIFEYHHRWKSLTLNDFLLKDGNGKVSNMKGANPKALTEPADTSSYMTPSDEVESPGDLNVLVLKMLIKMCQDRGTEFVLVSTPQVRDWNYARHNGCTQLAQELGIDFIDMNVDPASSEVGIDWTTDARDAGVHLNYRGAKKVSDWMATLLSETYGLTDHRNDEACAQWDECLTEYNKFLAKMKKDPKKYDIPGKHMY